MEDVGPASQALDEREDSEAKASLDALEMEAPVMDLNLQFYQGKIISEPHGVTVDEILSWYGDTYMLETYHGYIQWLFPTSQVSSGNRYAQPLQPEEAEAIQQDKTARKRFLTAYLMMLDFFGMTIVDYGTGTLARTQHYKDRMANLNYSTHNHIRITRIIKSLGEMGLERYQFPLVKILLVEAIWTWRLLDALPSARDFWIEAVKDASERNILKDYAVRLAKDVLDSVAPHAAKGKVRCNCQECAALREMRRLAPDYQPKAQTPKDPLLRRCGDANCTNCRNKVYVSNDRDQLVAQRVVQIEELNHLTLELGKISARLDVVAAERAQQKTIETSEQIEELACLMDELKQVSISLGLVSAKLEALSLGEKIIQKNEREMAAKRLVGQSVKACAEEEPCSATVEPVHDATPAHEKERAEAFPDKSGKTTVRFNLDSSHLTLDPKREVERANNALAQQSFSSSTAEGNGVLEGLCTIKDGSHTENGDNGQHKNESSAAGNPISAASEKRHLSKESAKKEELQGSHKTNSEGIEKDQIIMMTERIFSEFNSSLDPPGEKLDLKGSGRGGTKENGLDEDWELNDDNHASPVDDTQESEEALEEPTWMKAFRERMAQDKAAHT